MTQSFCFFDGFDNSVFNSQPHEKCVGLNQNKFGLQTDPGTVFAELVQHVPNG